MNPKLVKAGFAVAAVALMAVSAVTASLTEDSPIWKWGLVEDEAAFAASLENVPAAAPPTGDDPVIQSTDNVVNGGFETGTAAGWTTSGNTLLFDTFPTAVPSSQWETLTGTVDIDNLCGSVSAPFSISPDETEEVISAPLNMTGFASAILTFWVKEGDIVGCDVPSGEEELLFEFLNAQGGWVCLVEYDNGGTNNFGCASFENLPVGWNARTINLPVAAMWSGLKIRMRTSGDAAADFGIDDIKLDAGPVVSGGVQRTGAYASQVGTARSAQTVRIHDDFLDNDYTGGMAVWSVKAGTWSANPSSPSAPGWLLGTTQHQTNDNRISTPAAWDSSQFMKWGQRLSFAADPPGGGKVALARFYVGSSSPTGDTVPIAGSNGYFVQVDRGKSPDEVKFFRQDGASVTQLGSTETINIGSDTRGAMSVTRTTAGDWTVLVTVTGTVAINPITATDNTHTSMSHIGFRDQMEGDYRQYHDDVKMVIGANPGPWFFDDFWDGDLVGPTWTKKTTEWNAHGQSGPGEPVGMALAATSNDNEERISAPINWDPTRTMEWRHKLYYEAEGNSPISSNWYLVVTGDDPDNIANVNGYFVEMDFDFAPEHFRLVRQTGTGLTTIISGDVAITVSDWHTMVVTRSPDGLWKMSVDGNLRGSVVDTTHTSGLTHTGFRDQVRDAGYQIWHDDITVRALDYIYQDIPVPSGAEDYTLNIWRRTQNQKAQSDTDDFMSIDITDTSFGPINNLIIGNILDGSYQKSSWIIPVAYRGTTIRILMTIFDDYEPGTATFAYFDDITLTTKKFPSAPTFQTPFDNAKGGPWLRRPSLNFSASEPEGERLAYQVQLDDNPDFSSTYLDSSSAISTEMVSDGDLESGRLALAWTVDGDVEPFPALATAQVRTGTYSVQLGDGVRAATATDNMTQRISIPKNASSTLLRFYYRIIGTVDASEVTSVEIKNEGCTSILATVLSRAHSTLQTDWKLVSYDLGAFAGRTICLRFAQQSTTATSSATYVDDISVESVFGTPQLFDEFNTGSVDGSKWTNSGATSDNQCSSASGGNSLHLESTASVTSYSANLAGYRAGDVTLNYARGTGGTCEAPDNGDRLEVEYKNSVGTYVRLGCFDPAGTPCAVATSYATTTYNTARLVLPPEAFHSTFQVRIRSAGAADDDWGVDDVKIELHNSASKVLGWSRLPGPDGWTNLLGQGAVGAPPARHLHSAVYDGANDRMIVFAGLNSSTSYNDVWVLRFASGVGGTPSWINTIADGTGGSPSKRFGHSAFYDAATNRMTIFGGFDGTYTNNVWVLTNANGLGGASIWTLVVVSGGSPSGRLRHSAIYDQGTNTMTIFGGLDSSARRNDVWTLSNANNPSGTGPWTNTVANGAPGAPVAREEHTAQYDQSNNRMLVFGGIDGANRLNDLWALSKANGALGQPIWLSLLALDAPGSPSRRNGHASIYDQGNNRMMMFGGNDGSTTNTLWELNDANGITGTPTWRRIVAESDPASPLARASHTAVYSSTNDRMVIFGGGIVVPTAERNDVWTFHSGSPYPSGSTVRYKPWFNLPDDTRFYYRARALDREDPVWSPWTATRSIFIDTSFLDQRWNQTTDTQFKTDALVAGALVVATGDGAIEGKNNILLNDTFPTTTLDTNKWTPLRGPLVIGTICGVRSLLNAAILSAESGGGDQIESKVKDTSGSGTIRLTYWVKHGDNLLGCEKPEGGDNLGVDYWASDSTWKPITSHLGGQSAPYNYNKQTFDITAANAFHPNFKVRYTNPSTQGSANDLWGLDDVQIEFVGVSQAFSTPILYSYGPTAASRWDVAVWDFDESGGGDVNVALQKNSLADCSGTWLWTGLDGVTGSLDLVSLAAQPCIRMVSNFTIGSPSDTPRLLNWDLLWFLAEGKPINLALDEREYGVLFEETFPTTSFDLSRWEAGATAAIDTGCGPLSSPNSLHLESSESATTVPMNLAGLSSSELQYGIFEADNLGSPTCESALPGWELLVEYWTSGSTWVCMVEYDNGGPADQGCTNFVNTAPGWTAQSRALPAGALWSGVKFRFRCDCGAAVEDWGVDDIRVTGPVTTLPDGGNAFAGRITEFRVQVNDPQGTSDLDRIDLRLDGTTAYIARWTRSSDSFTEAAGGGSFDITSTSADSIIYGANQWNLTFKIRFTWTIAWDDQAKDPALYSQDIDGHFDLDTYSARTYSVDNDLLFTGSLTVYRGAACSGTLYNAGEWVAGSSALHWCGLNARYQADTSIAPGDSEFDLQVDDDDGDAGNNFWVQSTGASLSLTSIADPATDTSDFHIISIMNVPGGGPHGSTSREIKVDGLAPPAPALSVSPSGWSTTNLFNVSWSPSDDASGVASSKYKRCTVPLTSCVPTSNSDNTGTGTASFVNTVSATSNGEFNVYVWLKDVAGNEDFNSRGTATIKFDNTGPSFTAFEVYENSNSTWQPVATYWHNTNQTPLLRAIMSFNNSGLELTSVEYRYSTDGGTGWTVWAPGTSSVHTCAAMAGCNAGNGNTGTIYVKIASIPFNQDSATLNVFQVRARKTSGPSTLTTSTSQVVKIDTVTPASPVSLTANGASPSPWTNVDSFSIDWTFPADTSGFGSQCRGYRYMLDTAPTANGQGTLTTSKPFTTNVGGVSASHTLYVWLIDSACNENYASRQTVLLRYDANNVAYTSANIFNGTPLSWRPLTDWVSDLTPDLRFTLTADLSGIDVGTEQYRYSTNGGGSWTAWGTLPGGSVVCTNANVDVSCTFAADGATGTVYVKLVGAGPLIEHGTNNRLELRIRKISTQLGDSAALVVAPKLDVTSPAAPIGLSADGNITQSPLKASGNFSIDWGDPADTSGRWRALWKRGPENGADVPPTGGSTPDGYNLSKPFNLGVTCAGDCNQYLYVWILDSAGNKNPVNHAKVLLRKSSAAISYLAYMAYDPQVGVTAYVPITSFIADQTPDIRVNITLSSAANGTGYDVGTEEFRYCTNFNAATTACNAPGWSSWTLLNGGAGATYNNPGMTILTTDGWADPKWMKVPAVPFNQDSGTLDAVQVRMRRTNTQLFEDAPRVIKVDTTAPGAVVSLIANGASPSGWTATNSFSVEWTDPANENGASGRRFARYKIGSAPSSNSDYAFETTAKPITGVTAPSQGSHNLRLFLKDFAGNVNFANYQTVVMRYDSIAPDAPSAPTVDGFPATSQWKSTNSFSIDWTMPANEQGDVSGFGEACYKIGTPPTSGTDGTCSQPKPFSVAAPSQSSHSVYFWLKDASSPRNANHLNYASVTVRWDATAPDAPVNLRAKTTGGTGIGSSPSNWTNVDDFWVNATAPANEPGGSSSSGVFRYWYKLTTPPTSGSDGSSTTALPIAVTSVPGSGSHPLYVWLEDVAGNRVHTNNAPVNLRYDVNNFTWFETESSTVNGTWKPFNEFTNDQTPDIRIRISSDLSGVKVPSVQYRFTRNGAAPTPAWSQWWPPSGSVSNVTICGPVAPTLGSCTAAADGATGQHYIFLKGVPFNQDTVSNDDLRVQVRINKTSGARFTAAPMSILVDGTSTFDWLDSSVWDARRTIGRSLKFIGVDDRVNVPYDDADLKFSLTLSVETWVKMDPGCAGASTSTCQIVNLNNVFQLRRDPLASGANFSFAILNSGGGNWGQPVSSSTKPVAGVWYHLAATFDGTSLKIFVNGTLQNAKARSVILNQPNLPMQFGANVTSQYLAGRMDETRLYARALLDAEILQHYQNSFTNDANQVGYWSFNEGSGTTVADASGGLNHGTLCRSDACPAAPSTGPTFSTDIPLLGWVLNGKPGDVGHPTALPIADTTPDVRVRLLATGKSGVDTGIEKYQTSANSGASFSGLLFLPQDSLVCKNEQFIACPGANSVADGFSGTIYIKVANVTFNQDSAGDKTKLQLRLNITKLSGKQEQSQGYQINIDTSPPTPILDLVVDGFTARTVRLRWSPPTEPNFKRFEVCYSTISPVLSDSTCTWGPAQDPDLGDCPEPGGVCTKIYANITTITGLSPATSYFLKVRGTDTAGNVGPLSSAAQVGVTTSATEATGWLLCEGTNLVALATTRGTEWTAHTLGTAITDAISPAKAILMRYFDADTQLNHDAFSTNGLSWGGEDFTVSLLITNGWGLWIGISGAPPECSSFGSTGTEIVAPTTLTVREGGKFQLISVPVTSGPSYTASSLLKKVRDQNRLGCPLGAGCDFPDWDNKTISIEIQRWNGVMLETSTYSFFFGAWEFSGPDFAVVRGESYFVKVATHDNWGATVVVTP